MNTTNNTTLLNASNLPRLLCLHWYILRFMSASLPCIKISNSVVCGAIMTNSIPLLTPKIVVTAKWSGAADTICQDGTAHNGIKIKRKLSSSNKLYFTKHRFQAFNVCSSVAFYLPWPSILVLIPRGLPLNKSIDSL